MKRFALMMIALAFTGCGVRDVKYNPSHFRAEGVLAPPDVKLPQDAKAGEVIGGLHILSADAPTEELCCWIDTHASLMVAKLAGQRKIRVGAYVPQVDEFKLRGQKITLTFPNGRVLALPALHAGMNATVFDIPRDIVPIAGALRLRLSVDRPYFPGGPKSKPYGALLLSIYFE